MEATDSLELVLENLLLLLIIWVLLLLFVLAELLRRHVEQRKNAISCANEEVLVRFGVNHVVCGTFSLFWQLRFKVVLLVDVIKDLDRLLLGLQVFEWLLDAVPVDHTVSL